MQEMMLELGRSTAKAIEASGKSVYFWQAIHYLIVILSLKQTLLKT